MQWRSNHGSRNNQSNISSGNRKADFGKISDTRNGSARSVQMEALDLFYTSATGASFADDETGLYGQSALYIFGLFVEEKEHLNSM